MPSERSTAYLLFRLWAADVLEGGVGEIVVLPFHEIMPAVRDGRVDAGLVIHEARFTYQNYGLHKLADMGEHWESTTGLPIPLGAIIAKRALGAERLKSLAESIRASVRAAWDDPGFPGLMSWNMRRRWIPLSPISTLVCTSTSSPRTSEKTVMRRFGDC